MPDILIFVAKKTHITNSEYEKDPTAALRFWRAIQKAICNGPSNQGMKFVPIPLEKLEILVCIDAKFATNSDETSKIV